MIKSGSHIKIKMKKVNLKYVPVSDIYFFLKLEK